VTTQEQRDLVASASARAGGMAELAAALGVRPSTVYRWANGTRKMHGIAARAVRGYIEHGEDRCG